MRRAKAPRGLAETISEYVGAAHDKLGSSAPLAVETGLVFSSVLYAPRELDPSIIGELRDKVRRFRTVRRGKSA